jgi:hypothetical protein
VKIGAPPELAAPHRHAIFFASCLGLFVFSGVILWHPEMVVPWYDPPGHRWILSRISPTPVSMDFYGRIGMALAAGLLVAIVAGVLARKRTIGETLLRAAGIWAIGLLLFGMVWYGWSLSHRVIVPPHDAPFAAVPNHPESEGDPD